MIGELIKIRDEHPNLMKALDMAEYFDRKIKYWKTDLEKQDKIEYTNRIHYIETFERLKADIPKTILGVK